MSNTVVLQGICVKITDPVPTKTTGSMMCVMTLDCANKASKKIASPEITFYGDRATAVHRDICRGDTVTVFGTAEDRGSKEDGRHLVITGWVASVQKSVNFGCVVGRLQNNPKIDHIGVVKHLGLWLTVSRLNDAQAWIWVHAFGTMAEKWEPQLREGMLLCVNYTVETKEVERRTKQRPVVRSITILDGPKNDRPFGEYDGPLP
jgi:hypothetical protein